jgi:streptogramin lyase
MSKTLTFLFAITTTILTGQNASWQQFYPNTTVNDLAARGNTILVATDFGLTRFDTLGNPAIYDAINSGIPFKRAVRVAVDNGENWWVAHSGGIARYDGNAWSGWDSTQTGLSFSSTNARVLRASPDGRIGVAAGSLGCAIFENNTWTTLKTTNSGLPSDNVADLAFGADGKTYFATNAGLAVWDGIDWTVYNATNTGIAGLNSCKSVAVTSTGIVWVTEGTNRVAKFEANTWTDYAPADIGLPGVGFSVEVVVDEQDRLWITFTKSISVLDGAVWTHYLDADVGCTLLQLPTNKIRPAVDGAGQFWFWTSSCDLTRFDGQVWNRMDFGNAPDLPGAVYAITQDAAGNMWFGGAFAENGEVIAKKEGDVWETFNPSELGAIVQYDDVYTAEGDVLGNVWFGMIGGDILRFDGTAWSVFNDVKLAYPQIADYWTVNSDAEGTVWFAGIMGGAVTTNLIRYKAGEWTYFPGDVLSLPSNKFIISIAFGPDNTSWFLSNGGILLKFDGVNWENIDLSNTGLPFTFAHQMAVAPDGAVWLATDAGLARFDGTTWTSYTTANSDIPSDDIYRITFDKAGGMYIGFNPVGLSANVALLRGGEWSLLLPPGFEPGFSSEPYDMFVDRDNRLWFTGFQGATPVFVYDPMLVKTKELFSSGKQLSIFPNPALDVLSLQLPDWENQRVKLRVTDAFGRQLHHQTATVKADILTLELPSGWPAGIYYLEAINEQGERQTGRFVRAVRR